MGTLALAAPPSPVLVSPSQAPVPQQDMGTWLTPSPDDLQTLAEKQGFQPGWNSASGHPRVNLEPEKLNFIWADPQVQGNFCMLRALAGLPWVKSEQWPKNPSWSHGTLELLTAAWCHLWQKQHLSLGSLVSPQLQVHQLSHRSFKLLYYIFCSAYENSTFSTKRRLFMYFYFLLG